MARQSCVNQSRMSDYANGFCSFFCSVTRFDRSPPSAYSMTIFSFLLVVMYTSRNLTMFGWFRAYRILASLKVSSCSVADISAMFICLMTHKLLSDLSFTR